MAAFFFERLIILFIIAFILFDVNSRLTTYRMNNDNKAFWKGQEVSLFCVTWNFPENEFNKFSFQFINRKLISQKV